jgi:exonuclease SbcD
MFKFLHTADLHLGKVFHDHPLVEDQKQVLDQMGEILSDPAYGALIISGDIYDRSIPSPEAVALFDSFLGSVKARRPSLNILILPGNHDSPARLAFGRKLFRELGIYIAPDPEKAFEPVMLEQDGERCAFFLLPFLYPGSLSPREDGVSRKSGVPEGEDPLKIQLKLLAGEAAPEEPIRSQARLAREAALRLEEARRRTGADYAVLGAHLFTRGGLKSESERIFLGNAEQVDVKLFAGFDYAALGHLHRCQKAGPNAWYSGSPLAYSFDEADQEKMFLSVELSGAGSKGAGHFDKAEAYRGDAAGTAVVNPIPVRPLRKLRRLEGPFGFFFQEDGGDKTLADAEGEYLELSLTDTTLVENPLARLRRRFPYLMAVKQHRAFTAFTAAEPGFRSGGEGRNDGEDFAEFLADLYGEADPAKIGLFRELLEELDREEREA